MLLAIGGTIAMTSCSDDDNNYTYQESNIKIISAATEIVAAGETQQIVTDVPVASAYAIYQKSEGGENPTLLDETEWLTINISGTKVDITAGSNPTTHSRNVKLVLKNAEGDSTAVNIQQQGIVITTTAEKNIVVGDNNNTLAYDFNTNVDVTVSTSASWLTAELADGKLIISTEENNNGRIRTGQVYYQAGTVTDKIEVTQGDIDRDVVGKYYIFGGNDPDVEDPEDAEVSFLTAIIKNADTYNLVFPQFGWSMPVTFSKENLTMTLSAGHNMGVYQIYNMFSLIGDATAGRITWAPAVTMTASMKQYTETDEDGTYSFVGGEFKDDGKWTGYASDAFALGAFKSEEPVSDNFAGTLAFFTDVAIIEYDMENMSANKKAPKRLSDTKAKTKPLVLNKKHIAVK